MTMDDLPSGRFHDELAATTPDVQDAVLEKLSRLNIPEKDYNSLYVNRLGKLEYRCRDRARDASDFPQNGTTPGYAKIAASVFPSSVSIDTPPVRHSKPDSRKVLYLDFNGGRVSGTSWADTYDCLPIDVDNDLTTFSPVEQAYIVETWERVSEIFAPFDIDVTTEEPASYDDNHTAHAMITTETGLNGKHNPNYGYGGIACFDVFGESDYGSRTNVFFVTFYDLMWYHVEDTSNATAHEFGHNLGLLHDGDSANEYSPGFGRGYRSWSPIMGHGLKLVTQWSKGEYYDSDNDQDDLAIIANKLGYSPDDCGDTPEQAEALVFKNGLYSAKGTIGAPGDVDVYSFTPDYPAVRIVASPAVVNGRSQGGCSDLQFELMDESGAVIKAVNTRCFNYSDDLFTDIIPGRKYFVRINSVGYGDPMSSTPSGYTDYGSRGNYQLTITPKVRVSKTSKPYVGTTITLEAIAGGKGHFTYTWTRNNAPIDCYSSTLEMEDVRYADRGAYTVSAQDADGFVTTGTTYLLPRLRGPRLRAWDGTGFAAPVITDEYCDAVGLSASESTLAVLLSDGTLKFFGNVGNMGDDFKDIVHVSMRGGFLMAVKDSGAFIMEEVPHYFFSTEIYPPDMTGVIQISRGFGHVIALKDDGTAVAWGDDYFGQADVPDDLRNVCQISAGNSYSLALSADGMVNAWGDASSCYPRVAESLRNVVSISAGTYYPFALLENGEGISWNNDGIASFSQSELMAVEAPQGYSTNVGAIAITAEGTVLDMTSSKKHVPVDLQNVVDVANYYWSCALSDEERVSMFPPCSQLGGKWSTQWGWIDDTFYPWVYVYGYDDWMYLYNNDGFTVQNDYWIYYDSPQGYGWGYAYPSGGWYCLTSDGKWHWIKFGEAIPVSSTTNR